MATAERERPNVVVGSSKDVARYRFLSSTFSAHAARALFAAGLLFLLGSMADLAILWFYQFQPGNAYTEMVALSSTLEGLPRIALAAALIWAGMQIRGTTSLLAHRLLGTLLLLTGLAGGLAGALLISDYFVLRGQPLTPQAHAIFVSSMLKGTTLAGLHVLLLIPVGIMSVRRPRV